MWSNIAFTKCFYAKKKIQFRTVWLDTLQLFSTEKRSCLTHDEYRISETSYLQIMSLTLHCSPQVAFVPFNQKPRRLKRVTHPHSVRILIFC